MLAANKAAKRDGVARHDHAPGESDRKLRVIVVDDDRRVRGALRDLLESSADLAVVGDAGSGGVALTEDAEHAPDVVVLDLLLPSAADGLNVLGVLRSRDRPVVAMSVLGSLRQQALTGGAFAFLEKQGRDMDDLVDTVRAAGHRP